MLTPLHPEPGRATSAAVTAAGRSDGTDVEPRVQSAGYFRRSLSQLALVRG